VNVRELANRLGARIVERRGGISDQRWVLSEYETRNKTIVVYLDTIELLAELVAVQDLPFDVERLDEIAIAHECFHLLFPGKRGEEERAHAFAQELLDLVTSPAVLSEALASHMGGQRA
jgi:hypothetical protein